MSTINLPKLGRRSRADSVNQEPELTSKVARYAEYVPVTGLILGFLLIGIGWNGAASFDRTPSQIPYLISGGLIGLSLVVFASAAMVVQTLKKGQARQNQEFEKLNRTLERVASSLTFSSPNGHVEDAEMVVAGSTSFHLQDCRIVGNRKASLVKIPREEAIAEGLEPCRICNP